MPRRIDTKDDIVRCEVDLDHNVTIGHLFQESVGLILVHDVDPVADALRMAEIDCLTNMKTQTSRWDEARGNLSGVQADMNRRIDTVQVVQHKHLAVVFGHRHVSVLRLDEVETYDARILRGDLKCQQRLSEDLLWRKCP